MRALLFRCQPVDAAHGAGSGRCDDNRVAHRRSTRALSELIFLTIYHFIDVLIFFVFCSIRRQSWSGACVDALVARSAGSTRRANARQTTRGAARRFFFIFSLLSFAQQSCCRRYFVCLAIFENRRAPRRSVLSRRPARHDNDARC